MHFAQGEVVAWAKTNHTTNPSFTFGAEQALIGTSGWRIVL
jgi:hypothetical protein